MDKAKFYSEKWNSLFINIGKAGHINASPGYLKSNDIYTILEKIPK